MKLIHNLLAVGLLLLCSCNKENQTSLASTSAKGNSFTIMVNSIETKTVNAGYSTKWDSGDAVNVFHAVSGSNEYVNDGKFVIESSQSNTFTGELTEALLPDTEYDWYVYYPYSETITSPNNYEGSQASWIGTNTSSKIETQAAYDTMSHLGGEYFPMFGLRKSVLSNVMPSVSINHILSLIDVKVTNRLDKAITINSVYLPVFTSYLHRVRQLREQRAP